MIWGLGCLGLKSLLGSTVWGPVSQHAAKDLQYKNQGLVQDRAVPHALLEACAEKHLYDTTV